MVDSHQESFHIIMVKKWMILFSISSSRCYQQVLMAVPTLPFIFLLSLFSLSEYEGHRIKYHRKIRSHLISIFNTWFQFKAYIALQFGMYTIIVTLQPCQSLQLIFSDLNQHRRRMLFCLLNRSSQLNQQHICVI